MAAVEPRAAPVGTKGATRTAAGRPKPFLLRPAAKVLVFLLCALPLARLGWGVVSAATGTGSNALGANPAEFLIRATGDWTLRFLCLTLAITPVRKWFDLPALARFRRMIGLFAFTYAAVHFLCYSAFDMGFDWPAIVQDIAKRPFILVGTAALVLMAPLAATSFNRAIKALGAKRWQRLHRSVYVVVLLGLLHFFWMRAAKHNFNEVAIYGAVIAVLLGWRLFDAWRSARLRRGRLAAG